ncbi:hypothetical protein [Trinickia dinghuensis]|uniref:Uncharacterized protein n=1 Tax=Trinickia dinghuensis TaxID=2291023 RepID=A0A3D8JPU0_9BURK|nr:hypothetical protein [Trinickia dinghuensis]RDU94725.1 hypothetical protein DWV00_32495 [Trinickia dinghuensis]
MATLDMREELARTMHTADTRFAHQISSETQPHLQGETEVRNKKRRVAEIQTPQDRLQLAAEPRSNESNYVQLRRRIGNESVTVGRSQNPSHLPDHERHLYSAGSRGAPSYPAEARHLSQMADSDREAFALVQSEMMLEPVTVPQAHAVHLATTANIVGIAEQRRDPYMALASAQSIAHGAMEGSEDTLPSVFGQRNPKGSGNLPGSMPATGTGAVASFRGVRGALEDGTDTSPASTSVLSHMESTHRDLMASGFDAEQARVLAADGWSHSDIIESQAARMRSAATRDAARMTGQMPYRLRSLHSGVIPPKDD